MPLIVVRIVTAYPLRSNDTLRDHISLMVDLLEEDMLFEALICRAIGINAHSPRQGHQTHSRVPQREVSDCFVYVHSYHAALKCGLLCTNRQIDRDKNRSLPVSRFSME